MGVALCNLEWECTGGRSGGVWGHNVSNGGTSNGREAGGVGDGCDDVTC